MNDFVLDKVLPFFIFSLVCFLCFIAFVGVSQELELRDGTYTIEVIGSDQKFTGCKRTMLGYVDVNGNRLLIGKHATTVMTKEPTQ